MARRVHIWVSGRVQGVFFRHNTRLKALELGIHGWVKNRPNGQVEIVGEATKEQLEELVRWCEAGPPEAVVQKVEMEWEDYKGEFTSFDIRY